MDFSLCQGKKPVGNMMARGGFASVSAVGEKFNFMDLSI